MIIDGRRGVAICLVASIDSCHSRGLWEIRSILRFSGVTNNGSGFCFWPWFDETRFSQGEFITQPPCGTPVLDPIPLPPAFVAYTYIQICILINNLRWSNTHATNTHTGSSTCFTSFSFLYNIIEAALPLAFRSFVVSVMSTWTFVAH